MFSFVQLGYLTVGLLSFDKNQIPAMSNKTN
jgi:hypothetical protein